MDELKSGWYRFINGKLKSITSGEADEINNMCMVLKSKEFSKVDKIQTGSIVFISNTGMNLDIEVYNYYVGLNRIQIKKSIKYWHEAHGDIDKLLTMSGECIKVARYKDGSECMEAYNVLQDAYNQYCKQPIDYKNGIGNNQSLTDYAKARGWYTDINEYCRYLYYRYL